MSNFYPATYEQYAQETPQPIYSPTPIFPIQPYQSTQMAPQYDAGSQQQTFAYSQPQQDFINAGRDPYSSAYNGGTVNNYMRNMNQMSKMQAPQMTAPQMQDPADLKKQAIQNAMIKGFFGMFSSQLPGVTEGLKSYDSYNTSMANRNKKYNKALEQYYKAQSGYQNLMKGGLSNLNTMQGTAQKSNQNIATMGAGKDLYKTIQDIKNNDAMRRSFSQFAQKHYNISPQDLPYIDRKVFESLVKNFKAEGLDTVANSTMDKNASVVGLNEVKKDTEKSKQAYNYRRHGGGPRPQSLTDKQYKRMQTLNTFIKANTNSKGQILFGKDRAVKLALKEMEEITGAGSHTAMAKDVGLTPVKPKIKTNNSRSSKSVYSKYSNSSLKNALSRAKKARDRDAVNDLTRELKSRGVN